MGDKKGRKDEERETSNIPILQKIVSLVLSELMMATERQEKGEKDDEEGVQKTETNQMNKNSSS